MLRNLACLEAKPDNLFYPPKRGDYVYFEAAPPTPGSYLPDAAWAADAAMLAYMRYGAQRMAADEFRDILNAAGFSTVQTFGDCFAGNASTARGFFAANDERAILSFRGTEKDNLYDMAADGDVLMVDDLGARVHQGFQRYLRSVWANVSRLVAAYRQDHPTQDISITGHSLGGALATLAFLYLDDPATHLYTFGCPRVGDKPFCELVAAATRRGRCYRVVDNQDLVTHIPLPVPGLEYDHPAVTVLWFAADGAMATDPPDLCTNATALANLAAGFVNNHLLNFLGAALPGPLADHSPVRYCHWISEELLQASGKLPGPA